MTAPTQDTNTTAEYALAAAVAARAVQLSIRARLVQDVARLWPLLDAKRLSATFPGWLHAMTLLVSSYHGQSAVAAGSFYRAARAHALQSPTPSSLIHPPPAPSAEWVERAFGFSGPGMLSRDTAQPNTALSTTMGTAARIALDGGRSTVLETVKADPAAVGWYRVTDGHPCAFCAMLASRGIVYKRDTVAFQAHNDCGCSGAPAFSRSQTLPELSRTADDVYQQAARGAGPGKQLAAFRKAWDEYQSGAPEVSPSR